MRGNRNRQAAELIRKLRIDEGLTPEDLAHQIARDGGGIVSGRTVRRIESEGAIPTVRIQFALARHFGMVPSDLWKPQRRRAAA